jgi:hypothetical protein
MPAKGEKHPLPSPWKEFLSELHEILTEPLVLHCIGGFVLTFSTACPVRLEISTTIRRFELI